MTQIDQQNVPNLRFPRFVGDWGQTPLAKLVTSHNSGVYKKKELYGSGTNIIGVSNFYSVDSVDGQSFSNVPLTEAEISQFGLQEGDILYTESSLVRDGIAKALFVTKSGEGTAFAWHTRRYKVDRNRVFPAFLYFELSSQTTRKFITSVATQTALTGITTKDYFRAPIHLPTLPEQRKIAGFLGAVDTKIAQLAEKKRLLEDYKKGCMQQLFTQKIRFKDDTGNDFPDWEEKRLGEIGKTFGGLTGKSADDFGSGARFVTYVQVFKASQIYPEQCGFVEISAGERQNKIQRGDIIFTTSSETPKEVGFASVVTEEMRDTYLNSFCFALRPYDIEALVPEFSRYLFRSEGYRSKVIPLAQGSTRYNLSKTSFLKLKLHFPHPDEQRKIADLLSALDSKIDLVDQELIHARTFKRGLLQQMFV